jgi:hypothetical protein
MIQDLGSTRHLTFMYYPPPLPPHMLHILADGFQGQRLCFKTKDNFKCLG